jgi:hypothetical protein
MKFVKFILFYFIFFFCSEIICAQNAEKEPERKWYYPDYIKIQYAGNIGFISFGQGYQWWKQKAQTDILYGYVPEFIGNATIHTFTIKNTFRLYEFSIKNRYNLSPVLGFSVSLEPGQNSYARIPDKFPDGYYSTNNIYACINLGLKLNITPKKQYYFSTVEPYFELNTLADYVYYNILAQEDRENIILSFALGVNLYF